MIIQQSTDRTSCLASGRQGPRQSVDAVSRRRLSLIQIGVPVVSHRRHTPLVRALMH